MKRRAWNSTLPAPSKPMKRGGGIKPRRGRPRRESALRDEARKAWTRRQPCAVRMSTLAVHSQWRRCWGPVDPHHAGADRGLGQKAGDDTCIPLCRGHHGQIEDLRGVFAGWVKEQVREWQDARIAEYQARYAAETGNQEAPADAIPF